MPTAPARRFLLLVSAIASGTLAACDRGTVVVNERTPPVRALQITDPRDGVRLNLTWTRPQAEGLRGVRLLRRAGEPPLSPTDSFSQVAYEGNAETWSDEGFDGASNKTPLVVGTTYHYAAWALYGDDEFSSAVRAQETLSFFGPVLSFEARATDDGPVELSWVFPEPQGDIAGVRVKRARMAAPGTPGALDEKVLYEGGEAAFKDAAVSTGTRYFYSIITFDDGGTESSPVRAETTTRPGTITNLQVVPDSRGRISLAWNNPADERFQAARVVRRVGQNPSGPNDGDVICEAPGATSCVDRHPSPSLPTHYGVFAGDANGDFAAGIFGNALATDPVTRRFAHTFGGAGADWVYGTAAAPDGSIVVGGRLGYFAPDTDRTARFGSVAVTTQFTYGNGFVARYRADGTPDWVRTVSSPATESTSSVTAVAVQSDGSVFAAGKYFNTGVLSGGGVQVTLQPYGTACAGHACSDLFVARWSADGKLLWARGAGLRGGYGDETAFSIVPQADGGAVVAGVWEARTAGSSLTFGDRAHELVSPVQGDTFFVARYDANGNVAWARTASGTGAVNVHQVRAAPLPGGALLLAGAGGVLTLGTTTVGRGHFLARMSASGDFDWARPVDVTILGGNGPTPAALPGGDIVLAGPRYGVATFGTAPEAVQIGTEETYGAYVARYSAGGQLRRVDGMDAPALELQGLVPLADGGCAVAGVFTGTLTAGSAGDRLQLPGHEADALDYDEGSLFLVRYDAAGAPVWARTNGTAGRTTGVALARRGARELVLAASFSGSFSLFQGGAQPATLVAGGNQSERYQRDDGMLVVLDDAAQ